MAGLLENASAAFPSVLLQGCQWRWLTSPSPYIANITLICSKVYSPVLRAREPGKQDVGSTDTYTCAEEQGPNVHAYESESRR